MSRRSVSMENKFESNLTEILKCWVSPFLKSHGFKKRRETYVRECHELCWLIGIQRSRWNDQQEAQFTLNCGIYVPGLLSTYINQIEPTHPKISDCCLTARIGMLSETQKDQWWVLRFGDPLIRRDEIGKEIQEQIKNNMFPFLQRFKDRNNVIDFFISPRSKDYQFVSPQSEAQCLAYTAILYSILGWKEKCLETLNAAVNAALNTPIESVVLALKDRIA